MKLEKITIQTTVSADKQKAWDYYTLPEHITEWNFADPSWHCPIASNDLQIGGRYFARIEAKNGSIGFDFDATYTEINVGENFTYKFGDRFARVEFIEHNGQTHVSVTFDPESENLVELQRDGWQAILDNYKHHTENS